MKSGLLRCSLPCLILLGWGTAGSARGRIDQFPGTHRAARRNAVMASQVIHVGDASIQIDFGPGDLDVKHEDIVRWVEAAPSAVSVYYGRFPVARARVLIVPVGDELGVLTGTTWDDVDGFPAFTRMRVGQHTTVQALASDWTMTHEFVHMGFPSLSQNHHWLEEGLATYIEPIARSQAGILSPEKVWGEMVRNMPKGEPGSSDHGLDLTHTWASTYWGGALFCMVADVSIREQTGNSKGLPDALRAIIAARGTIDQEWPISRALAVGDHATGTSVLTNLYQKMEEELSPVNLSLLLKQLGIVSTHAVIAFDNQT